MVNHESVLMDGRSGIEPLVKEAHQQDPSHQGRHKTEFQFDIDSQQQEKWQKEMAEDNHETHQPPKTRFTQDIMKGFLRHVGVPDDEVLREVDVRVEHRK